MSSQVLYHDSVSMIMSRFTSFAKDFEIRSHLFTKIVRSGHDYTSAFSARNPENLGSQADVAMSVLREVSKDAVLCLPDTTFARGPKVNS